MNRSPARPHRADRLVTACMVFTCLALSIAPHTALGATCLPGEYLDGGVCFACPLGFFCPGNDARLSCPNGYYSAVSGSTVCSPCLGSCQTCSATTGGCVDCPSDPARWLSGASGGTGTVCVSSCGLRYRSAGQCVSVCPGGNYALAPDTLCQPCLRQNGCILCDPYSGDCTLCQNGDYPDGPSCSPCPSGQYGTGGLDCQDCAAGTHNTDPGSTSCPACPEGTWSGSGAAVCGSCSPGTEASADRTSCLICEPGSSNGLAGGVCVSCSSGTFAPGSGASSCGECAGGTYSGYGATACSSCEPGTYSDNGAAACTSCVPGTYSGLGEAACSLCGPGTYSGWGWSACSLCPPGTYNPHEGAEACADCPLGYTSDPGSVSAEACRAAAGTQDILVTDDTAPFDDLAVAFGSVAVGGSSSATVTVRNSGSITLVVGILGGTHPLDRPFSLADDNCSAATVTAANPCTFRVVFEPSVATAYADSLDIPSDDPDPVEDPVILAVTGSGYLDSSPAAAVGGTSGGCFVATAAFGSGDAWAVRSLQRFRDDILMSGRLGRSLVRGYYRISPSAAAWIAHRPYARLAVRIMIAPAAGLAWILTAGSAASLFLLALLPCAVALGLLLRVRRPH